MGAITEEQAVTAVENSLSYPRFVISGTNTLLCMAASALAEPDNPPISVESTMFTCPSPPRRCPVKAPALQMPWQVTRVEYARCDQFANPALLDGVAHRAVGRRIT